MVIVIAVAVAAAIGGTAVAAGSSSPNSFLDDFAQHLGVTPAKVQSAYQATITDRLNALVKQGKLTQQQADAIERHMKDHPGGPFMGFGFFGAPHASFGFHAGGPFGHFGGPVVRGPFGPLQAAATYLGVYPRTLAFDLRSGKTLANIATAQKKSVTGLEAAMLAAVTRQLDAAVKAGHLSSTMEARIKTALSRGIDDFVQHGFRFHRHMGPWGAPGNDSAPGQQVRPSAAAWGQLGA